MENETKDILVELNLEREKIDLIDITYERIDLDRVLASVTTPACGAQVLFVGTTRQWTEGVQTLFLEYESYLEMAKRKLENLESEARSRWPIAEVTLVHRLGRVDVGQASVAVAVGSPHREAAFTAAKWLIDELKTQVPIWKKEHGSAGSEKDDNVQVSGRWVHPS